MAASARAVGSYVASEVSLALWGRGVPQGRTGILICQGGQGTADKCWITAAADGRRAHGMVAEFFPCFAGDLGQTASAGVWGNDTGRTRMGQLKSWAQDASKVPLPAATGSVYIFAGSGGMLQALNYARANASSVKAIVGGIPLTNLDDFYNEASASSFVTDINKAYNAGVDDGGTAYQAAKAAHDPAASGNQAALATVPILMLYSPDDPLIDPSWPPAYAALVNAAGGSATAVAMPTGGGHSYTNLNPYEVVDFFLAHP